MRAFLERVAATISAHAMLAPGQRVLVALSGGPDSTALLHVLHRLGYPLIVAHVHHGLRGAEADADAAHARTLADSLEVPFHLRRADVASYAQEHKLSLETAAREVRYRLLEEVAQEVGASRIATGHTADDQAETVLLNLLRGAGPAGLSGIPPVRGAIIRPLLEVTHAQVEGYCREAGLEFRLDTSNRDRRFTRNRIRHDLLPLLAEIQPQLTGTLARLAEIMREENAFLESLVDQLVPTVVTWGEEEARLALHDLHSLPKALQRRLLRRVVAVAQGHATDIEFQRIEAITELAEHGRTGAVVELPGGLQAERSYGELIISAAQEHAPISGEWVLPVPGSVAIPELGVTLHAAASTDAAISDDPWQAVVDAETVTVPLLVRPWRAGDSFVPLGMTEAMKLQDYFVNAKVPRGKRHRTPLVLSGERIMWVAGQRIANPYRVTPNTRRTIRLRVEHTTSEGE